MEDQILALWLGSKLNSAACELKALLGFSGFQTMDADEARMWLMFVPSFSA